MEKTGKGRKPTKSSYTFEYVPESIKLKDNLFYFILKRQWTVYLEISIEKIQ